MDLGRFWQKQSQARSYWTHWLSFSYVVFVGLSVASCQQPGLENMSDINICVVIAEIQAERVAYRRFAAIIDIAIKHANNLILPPNVTFHKFFSPEVSQKSGPCVSGCTASRALALLDSGVNCHVFLGPDTPNGVNNMYGVAYKHNIPVISFAEYGITNRAKSPLLTLPFLNVKDMTHFIVTFLKFRNYSYVTVFQDLNDKLFSAMGDDFYDAYSKSYSSPNQAAFNLDRLTTVRFRPNVTSDDEMETYLQHASTRSRIFVIFTFFDDFKKLMLTAKKLQLTTPEYEYLTVHPYDDVFYGSTDLAGMSGSEKVELLKILRGNVGIVSVKLTRPPFFTDFMDQVKQVAHREYNYSFATTERVSLLEPQLPSPDSFPVTIKIDALVTAHYDAVTWMAAVVTQLYNSGKDITDGTLLSQYFKNTSYSGLQTGRVQIDATGDAQMSYEVLGIGTDDSEFSPIWEYISETQMFLAVRPTSTYPLDVPVCGFTGDNEFCRETAKPFTASMALYIGIPLLVVLALAVWFFARTIRRLKGQLNPNWWKITSDELQFPANRKQDPSHTSFRQSVNSDTNHFYSHPSAMLNNVEVSITDVSGFRIPTSTVVVKQLNLHRNLHQDNLQKFIGICLDKNEVFNYIIAEHCSKGDLTTILENRHFKLDWSVKNSLIKDLIHGMAFLHSTSFNSHGNLNSYNCLIDGKFTLKVTGYGHPYFRVREDLLPLTKSQVERNYEELLWRAPELLSVVMPSNGTQKGDVYSFAIVLQQIILERRPYEMGGLDVMAFTTFEILLEVKINNVPPTRPVVPRSSCSSQLYDLMERCWSEYPLERPSFAKIRDNMRRTLGSMRDNIVDQLMKRMEEYAATLEMQVAEKTNQFLEEKQRSDNLLSLILPKSVAAALIKGETVQPESYENVTIYFSDVVGFTKLSSDLSPLRVIDFLNALYTMFDRVLEMYDVYKVETIGDAYMVVSGLPLRNGRKHVTEMSYVALHLLDEIKEFRVSNVTDRPVQVRIGLNTGPCVAGVVGLKMPRYCLFGDTVNTASRMESTSEPMRIQISETTEDWLGQVGGFVTTKRGDIEIKGKGILTTYWLISANRNLDSK